MTSPDPSSLPALLGRSSRADAGGAHRDVRDLAPIRSVGNERQAWGFDVQWRYGDDVEEGRA